ncbi:MAG: hypothetical protein IJX69_01810 [Oscillospiraceae bacterium]|nr:hypothetical protein [Oscillospiraceae bacterium]
MKKQYIRLIAFVLALMLALTGCSGVDEYFSFLGSMLAGTVPLTHFDDMEYTRPDISEFQSLQAECSRLAEEGGDFDALEENIYLLFEEYYDFSTNYALANIHYCIDTTDLYWSDEYYYCLDLSDEVSTAMEQLSYVLAASEFRETLESDEFFGPDYFDDYDGKNYFDDTFSAMLDEESALLNTYYELNNQLLSADYGSAAYLTLAEDMADLYAELISLRRQQSEYAGFDTYADFAYDYYYSRDYTPTQEAAYLEQLKAELVPLYRQVCTEGVDGAEYKFTREETTFEYVRDAATAMGGVIEDAFTRMEEAGLYHISYGENKYNASFETYLISYYEPFIFINPSQDSYDKLTFAHEFGHFCNEYASYGSMLGIDAMEIFSQGMEYLSLLYCEDTEDLAKLKLFDSLCTYVEQAAYADFERQAHLLPEEELTGENLIALFEEVTTQYGFDLWHVDGRDFVTVPHFFISPMYVFSYVVSNDAAMQIYQLELAESGSGLQVYMDNLSSEEAQFLAFLESAGLESPFADGRLATVRKTFENALT